MSPKRQAETSHLFMLSLAVYLNSDIVLFGVGFHSEESMKCVTTSEGTETVNRLTLAKVFYNPCTLPDKKDTSIHVGLSPHPSPVIPLDLHIDRMSVRPLTFIRHGE